jgi:predicted secreted protein
MDPLPTDEASKAQALQLELGMKTVSRETVAGELGRDWAVEQDRIAEESAAGSNLGEQLLQAFNRGV